MSSWVPFLCPCSRSGFGIGRLVNRLRWALLVFVCVGTGLTGSAAANSYGHFYLQGGVYYSGTRASITTPASTSDWTLPANCALMRSDAEMGDGNFLIQTGFLDCAPGYDLDFNPTCSGAFTQFVERQVYGQYYCYAQGTAPLATSIKYSVADLGSNQVWQAFIAGYAKGPTATWEHDAVLILEGGEYDSSPTCGTYWVWAPYAETVAWQFFWPSNGWINVSQASTYEGTCWHVAGTPSSTFEPYHTF